VDLSALAVLGTVSAVIAGAVVVEPQLGWQEPVNLYINVLAAPGEGKTPVLEKVVRPLDAVEQERRDRVEPARVDAEAQLRIAETRRKRLEDTAAKSSQANRQDAEAEARQAATEAAAIKVPALPRVYTRETTPEGCVRLLGEQKGRLAVVSDEGSEFFQLTARYSGNGKGNLGIFLDGHDGKRHVSDRAGRDPIVIERVTLTVCLFSQPIILADLARDPQMAGRGLTARFLWSLPSTMVGFRPVLREPVAEELNRRWADLILQLAREADTTEEPFVLRLDDGAKELFTNWRAQHEPRLLPGGGDLSSIVEWGSKLPGQVLRLAGNLHALRTGHVTGTIDEVTMRGALMLAPYFIDHALVIFAKMGADPRLEDAALNLGWLEGHNAPEFTTREIARSKSWPAKRVRTALELLVEYGWIRPIEREPRSGRPSERWEKNPQLSGQNLTEVGHDGISAGFVRADGRQDSDDIVDTVNSPFKENSAL
jgi:hypothetical protein